MPSVIPGRPPTAADADSTSRATSVDEADRRVASLASRKEAWVALPVSDRVRLLRRCITGVLEIADRWVAQACAAKRVALDSPWAGEEWISGPMVTVRYLRLLAEALEADGRPAPAEIRSGPRGQTIARVFPRGTIDRILYAGLTADLWVRAEELPTQGRIYRDKRAEIPSAGKVALVLGAGNVSSIAPADLLQKLFVEDQVVLLKMNPVNEYLGPLFREAFQPLTEGGYLDFVYGGAAIGSHLCRHEQVDTIHLTGSDRTYDAIVWGATADERRRRKAAGDPRVSKPFTAELGCVSPVIVVPGVWSKSEIEFQARNVAAMVVHNASFNCNAAKVLVLPDGWRQKEEFQTAVRKALSRVPPRPAYYPGAGDRYREFVDRYPQAIRLSDREAEVPWTLIPEVPARAGEYALSNEAFCGVIAEVSVPAGRAGDPASFLAEAVSFVNESVWGTLSCTVLVSSAARSALGSGLERAIDRLRYGAVGVNVWPGVIFGLGETSWGAFPGHTREQIGSGVGVVHNALLFDHPEKSVAWAPTIMRPTPPWFADHRNLPALGRRITAFEAAPGFVGIPALGLSALLG